MNWDAFRSHFPVTEHWAFLDHAAVAPPPQACADAIATWAQDKARNGIATYHPWAERLERTRQSVGQLLNAPPDDICFVGSTTAGIAIVAEGYPWQPGDNVVTVAEEYPSNQYPWLNLRDRGVEVRSVPSRDNVVHLDDVLAAINDRTRVLAISSVEYSSGYRNDLEALGTYCRTRGVFFFVDAIQSLGALPLDLQQTPIDGLAADSHKWLLGPEGAGIAYLRPEWVDRFHAIGVGWNSVVHAIDFSRIELTMKPHIGRWEGGTVNVGGLAGMGESIRLLLEFGVPALAERIRVLTDYLCEQLPRHGFDVFSHRTRATWSGIVSVRNGAIDPKHLMRACRTAGIIVNVRGGRLRISPHAYNTFDEIDRLIAVLAHEMKGTHA